MTKQFTKTKMITMISRWLFCVILLTGMWATNTAVAQTCTTATGGTLSATPTGPFCFSAATTINTSVIDTGSGLNYQWQSSATGAVGSFADMLGQTNTSLVLLGVTASTYYRLVVVCANGPLSDTSAAIQIVVNALPTVGATASPSATVCAGSSVTLNGTGATSYSWNNGVTDGVAFTANTTTTYTVTGTDANGCQNTATQTVTVNSPTAYAVTGGGAFCTGGTGVAVGLANSQSGVNYQLVLNGSTNVGSPVAGNGSSITFNLQTALGTYTVVATDATSGCTANMTGSVIISNNANPTASASASCSSIYKTGQTTTITATATAGSGTISTYQWVLNGSTNVGTNSSTYSTSTPGSYTVTVTNSNGCSVTSNAVVITNNTSALSGAYAIPGTGTCASFSTLQAFVAALDSYGVSASVTANVAAGFTETAPVGGYMLGSSVLNPTLSATKTLTIQKSGSGANPLINSYTGTIQPTAISSLGDGMFNLNGVDYTTINGIDLKDVSALGTAAASNNYLTTMEWGYGLFKLNSSGALDGCQNDAIKNCTITLSMGTSVIRNRRNPWSCGITMDNRVYNGTMSGSIYAIPGLTPLSAADANSNNTFASNTLYNVGNGIFMRGYYMTSAPNTALYDVNNTVGGNSSATGNSILSWGGSNYGSTTGYGVVDLYQINALIKYNTIDNKNSGSNGGVAAKGAVYGIYAYDYGSSGYSLFVNYNNNISNNTITLNDSVTYSTTDYGIYYYYVGGSRTINNNTVTFGITNIATTTAQACSFYAYYIYYGVSPPSNPASYTFNFQGNSVPNVTMGTGTFGGFYLYGQGFCGTVDISGNSITGLTRTTGTGTTVTSTTTYLFYNYYNINYATSGTTTNIYNNTLSNINFGNYCYGTVYGYYCGGAYNMNMYNNTFSNFSSGVTASAGTIYCMYPYYGTNFNVYNNNISNITSPGTFYGLYGYFYNGGSAGIGTANVYNNTITGLSSPASTTAAGTTYGMYAYNYYIGTANYYNNTVTNLSSTAPAQTQYGLYIYANAGGTHSFYKNTFAGITNTSATAGAASNMGLYIYGYNSLGNGAAVWKIYNNIFRLSAPASSNSATGAIGFYANSYSASTSYNYTANLSYNDFYIDGSSAQAAFGSAALYQPSTSTPLTQNVVLKNNLFINACTNTNASPTGRCVGIRNASSSIGYAWLNNASTNNIWYSGPTSSYSALLWDGTTLTTTLTAMKGVLAPRESGSYTENPPFLSTVVGNSNFMKINTTIGTQIESGAVQVAGITDDFAGTIRQGNTGYLGTSVVAPDCGAYEGDYVALDLSAPNIIYTALSNACGTANRTLTANLVDVTGVDNTTYLPTLYYKKGFNHNSWSGVQTATGSLASGTVKNGTWNFTISSAAMGGLTLGDTVYYFVTAQDVAATPNMGSNTPGVTMTNANTITGYPTYAATPKYSVVPVLSGTYNVGAGMAAGGGFNTLTAAAAAYGAYCVQGAVTFLLTDSVYTNTTETYPITFNYNAVASTANTLTIRPAVGNNVRIKGTATGGSLIVLNGANYVRIDGSNTVGGSTQNMTFWNSNNIANQAILLQASGSTGAANDTIRNCAFVGGSINNGTIGATAGIYGISISGADPDYDAIINCSFQAMYNAINVAAAGTATAADNLYIGYCTVGLGQAYPTGTQSLVTAPAGVCTNYGMYFSNCNNMTIEKNDIGGVYSYYSPYYPSGVAIGSGITGGKIDKNKIHGIAMPSTGGWGAYGIYITSGSSPNNLTISNNFIYDVLTENYSNTPTIYNAYGIFLYGSTTNLNILYNTINLFGTVVNSTSQGFNTCIGSYSGNVNTTMTIKGNILSNTTNSSGGSGWLACDYGFYNFSSNIPNTGASYFDYNDIYNVSSTTTGQVGTGYYLYNYNSGSGPVAYTTLLAVQQLMGGDLHSLALQPPFVSNSDLHINSGTTPTAFESSGFMPASVSNDIDGDNRPGPTGSVNGGGTKPDIGADEFDGTPLVPCSSVTGGTTTGTNPICKNTAFLLNLSGATSNLIYSGLSYQWRQSTNGGTTWANATAAGTSGIQPTMISAGINTPTIYHCVITCANGGAKDSSSNLSLTLDTFLNCYCIPVSTYGSYISQYGYYGDITNVTFGTINNPTQSFGPAAAPFFTAYPQTVNTTLISGNSYGMAVTIDNYGYSRADMWVDYNRSGTYDASEWTSLGSNSSSSYPTVFSQAITVPATVSDGWSKVRIRSDYYSYTPAGTDACTSGNPYYYGETQDYYVFLVSRPANPGNPTEGATPVSCSAGTTLTPSGTPSNNRTKWYWESSATDTTHTYGNLASVLTIHANGTYYIRAYDTVYHIWSTGAGSKVVSDFPAGPATPPTTAITGATPVCSTGGTLGSALTPSAGITYFYEILPTNTLTNDTAATNTYSKSKSFTTNGSYYVKAQDSVGCWSTGAASKTFTVLPSLSGATFTVNQITTCGGTASVIVNNPNTPPYLTLVNLPFTTFTNQPLDSVGGTATVSGGICMLNQAAASQTGGYLAIRPTGSTGSNPAFVIDYDFQTVYGNGNADGMSYSFGDDVVNIPTGLGSTTNGAIVAPGATNPENGSGTKLKLSFDAYTNGTNLQGIYLMYNCPVWNQSSASTNLFGPGTGGVLGFLPNTSWFNTTTQNNHVKIVITSTGYITVYLNSVAIFNNIQLPTSYLAANKSNWRHVFCARTGTVYEQHNIDNFVFQYQDPNYYLFSDNNGATTQTNNVFNEPIGSFPISITYSANPACNSYAAGSPAVVNNFHVTPGTITTNTPTFCNSGTPTLTLTGNTGGVQWQKSANANGPWTNVGTVNSLVYTPTAPFTANTYVRAYSNCTLTGTQPNMDSSVVFMQPVLTPSVTSVTRGIHCGYGTDTLKATVSTNSTANWYATSSATTPIVGASGVTKYLPPASSTTTNYYVTATGTSPITGTIGMPAPQSYYSYYTTYGLTFNANSAFTLTSVKLFPYASTNGTAGTVTINLVNSAGTVLQTTTVNVTGYVQSTANLQGQQVPVNFYIPAGSGYGLQMGGYTGISGCLYEYGPGGTGANFPYPYTDVNNIVSITAGNLGTPSTTYLYYYCYFYNWNISWQCESSPKTKDSLYITPAPSVSVTNSAANPCLGNSSVLAASSTNSAYAYNWSVLPATGAGLPGTTNTASITVQPTVSGIYPNAASYVYTVVATDNSGGAYNGCAYSTSTTVNSKPLPPITTKTATPSTLCAGSTATLTAASNTLTTVTVGTGTVQNTTTTYPTPYGLWYGSSHQQFLILASELTALGLSPGNMTSLAFDVASISNTTYNYQYFTISMAPTALTNFSGYTTLPVTTGFTTCYTNTPGFKVTGTGYANNTYAFTTPFAWNGTSNVVVDVMFSNCSVCNGTSSCTTSFSTNDVVNQTTTSFVSSYDVHTDNNCTINSFAPSITGTTFSQRPNMRLIGGFNATASLNWLWTPGTTTGAVTTRIPPVTAGVPSTTTKYYISATNPTTGCNNKDSVTVTVNEPPSITVQPVSTNGTACAYSSTSTFIVGATGSGSLIYQWQDSTATGWVNISNGTLANGTQYSGTTTSTLSVANAPYTMTGHKYHVTVNGGCNPLAVSNTVKLNLRHPASAVLSGSQSITIGNTATIQVALTGSAPWSVTLSDGSTYNNITTTPFAITKSPTQLTTYTIASLTDSSGCTTTNAADISGSAVVDVYAINDQCVSAIALNLTVSCAPVAGTSFNGHSSTTPTCTGSGLSINPDDDVWYELYIPAGLPSVTISVQAPGTFGNFDAAFEVLKGNCGALQSVACVNNSSVTTGSGSQEYIVLNTNLTGTNTTIYIRVYDARTGWGQANGGNGQFQICTYGLVLPTNGTPCTATNMSTNVGSIGNLPTQVLAYSNGVDPGLVNDDPNGTGTGLCYTASTIPASSVAGTYKPVAANLVYMQGTTAFAYSSSSTPMPPTITNPGGNTQKVVWFNFNAPTVYDATVDLNMNFANSATYSSATQQSNWIIALYTISGGGPCTSPVFTPVYYNGTTSPIYTTTGKVTITGADFSYNNLAGQPVYAELMLPSGAGGNYLMAIHASVPNITLQNPTTSTLTATWSGPFLGVNQQKLSWRARPNPATNWCQTVLNLPGYTFTYVPTNSTSYTINSLISGNIYDAWMTYYGTNSNAFNSKTATLGTTVGCSAQQPAPTILPVIGHCSRDTVKIPTLTLPLISSYPYRVYWYKQGSTGYSVVATNNLKTPIVGLQVNGITYNYLYSAICQGGASVVSATTSQATCFGAAAPNPNTDPTNEHTMYEVNGVYFVDMDIRDVIMAAEATHADLADGQVHYYPLHRVDAEGSVTTSTEMADVLTGGFDLIPNPTTNRVKVQYNLPEENLSIATIKLMDISGRVIRAIKLDNPTKEGYVSMDLTDLNSGIYLVNVQTEGYTETKKLVVSK